MTDEQYEKLPELFKDIVDIDRRIKQAHNNHMPLLELQALRLRRCDLMVAAQKQYGHSIRTDNLDRE